MSSIHSYGSPVSTTPFSSSSCSLHASRCPSCFGPICPVEKRQPLYLKHCQLDKDGMLLPVCAECGRVHAEELENEEDWDPSVWE